MCIENMPNEHPIGPLGKSGRILPNKGWHWNEVVQSVSVGFKQGYKARPRHNLIARFKYGYCVMNH